LIRTCEDTSRGLKTASIFISDAGLRPILAANARELEAFVKQLQSLVLLRGGRPAKRGTTSGALDRGLMSLRAALPLPGGGDLVDKCEELEATAERAYDRALETPMPREQQLVLSHHRHELREMQSTLDAVTPN
jgi:uncharacterized protein (TIGR02284 family)